MHPTVEAQLQVGDVTVSREDVALLRAIDEEGSLNAASDALGRSFSRAHSRLATLEEAAGTLVERQRGGAAGGGSELTDGSRGLLRRFARLEASLAGPAGTEGLVLRGRVTARDGELATVETDIGTVETLLFEETTEVQVTVPSDALTLQSPSSAPTAAETSARNRYVGTVETLDEQESIAFVTVALDGEAVQALVTAESVRALELDEGAAVVVSFKATAARATEYV